MKKEFELVSHSQLNHINVFLVRLTQRSIHLHRDLELGLVLDGGITLHANHSSHELKMDDIYLVNPMEPHEFISQGGGALILALQLSPQLGEQFFPDAAGIRFSGDINLRSVYVDKPQHYELIKAICVYLAHFYLSRAKNFEFKCLSLVSMLLHQLTEHVPWSVMSGEDSIWVRQRAERIFSITDYIERNFKRKLLLSEIAQHEKLSLTYLSHFFKDTMGITFQDYLNQTRFDYACTLLENTDRSILDISLSSGFSDVRYFNRMFQEHYGVSPNSYRGESQSRAAKTAPIPGSIQHIFSPEEAVGMLTSVLEQSRQTLSASPLADLFVNDNTYI